VRIGDIIFNEGELLLSRGAAFGVVVATNENKHISLHSLGDIVCDIIVEIDRKDARPFFVGKLRYTYAYMTQDKKHFISADSTALQNRFGRHGEKV
jgi:hypothetical protein